MAPDRLPIIPDLPVWTHRDFAIQLQFARDHGVREITFADKVWYDVDDTNRFRIEQKPRIAQARLFFPKRALHIGKNVPPPNFRRVGERWRARIRIYGRAVADDQ